MRGSFGLGRSSGDTDRLGGGSRSSRNRFSGSDRLGQSNEPQPPHQHHIMNTQPHQPPNNPSRTNVSPQLHQLDRLSISRKRAASPRNLEKPETERMDCASTVTTADIMSTSQSSVSQSHILGETATVVTTSSLGTGSTMSFSRSSASSSQLYKAASQPQPLPQPAPTQSLNSNDTMKRPTSKRAAPKAELYTYCNRPPLRLALGDANYVTWDDGRRPHEKRYTSVFIDPSSGECFASGRYGDEKFYSQDPVHNTIWYTTKKFAEHGAAALAHDCLIFRATRQSGTSSLAHEPLSKESPYLYEDAAPFVPPPSMPSIALQKAQAAIASGKQAAIQSLAVQKAQAPVAQTPHAAPHAPPQSNPPRPPPGIYQPETPTSNHYRRPQQPQFRRPQQPNMPHVGGHVPHFSVPPPPPPPHHSSMPPPFAPQAPFVPHQNPWQDQNTYNSHGNNNHNSNSNSNSNDSNHRLGRGGWRI